MEAFRQFFDTASSTFTYSLVDPMTCTAVIIDPVDAHLDDYLDVIAQATNRRLGLDLQQA